MSEKSFSEVKDDLQCQFLCGYPLYCIDWKSIPTDVTWEQQKELIDGTCSHPLNQAQPVKIAYQLNFLKRLLQYLESHCAEVHDAVYESYCQIQQQVAQDAAEKYAYKHYLVRPQNARFTLRESKSFVAEGTTGLCSWQASLALTDYLLHHADLVRHKGVMELGAGTGLCGLVLAHCCAARAVLLTDGSEECVSLMCENVARNFPAIEQTARGCFAFERTALSIEQLAWKAIDASCAAAKLKPDVLLAADVVYDDTVFDDLSFAIDYVFNSVKDQCNMLLAATVRNEHTLKKFLDLLSKLNFEMVQKPVIPTEESYLHWDRTTPVKLFRISRISSDK